MPHLCSVVSQGGWWGRGWLLGSGGGVGGEGGPRMGAGGLLAVPGRHPPSEGLVTACAPPTVRSPPGSLAEGVHRTGVFSVL